MSYMYLPMGHTEDGNFIFADVYVRGNNTFTACFNEVAPIEDNDDNLRDSWESLVDSADDSLILSWVRDFDCRPSELVDCLMYNYGWEDAIDNSLFSDFVELSNGTTYLFDSVGCGQMDVSDELIPINDNAFRLIEFWKAHHLTEINSDELDELEDIIEGFGDITLDEYIKSEMEKSL